MLRLDIGSIIDMNAWRKNTKGNFLRSVARFMNGYFSIINSKPEEQEICTARKRV